MERGRERERGQNTMSLASTEWLEKFYRSITKLFSFLLKENPTQFVYWSEGHEEEKRHTGDEQIKR